MPNVVVITAVGQDKPGIIAALADAVLKAEGTLDDATMTRLHGAFAAMLSARIPSASQVHLLRDALFNMEQTLGVAIGVDTVSEAFSETPPDIFLTVYGADKPGIVHAVAQVLSEMNVNITDMDTRMAGTPVSPLYIMHLEASTVGLLPDANLAGALEVLGRDLGVDITLRALDSETL